MGESGAGNGRWKRGEEYGRDGTSSTLFDLEMALASDQAPAPCKVAYCTRSHVLNRAGWLPRIMRGEHGRIAIFSALTEYVRE